MKQIQLKTAFCLISMLVFLGIAIISKDMIDSKLFSALSIILGALGAHYLSNQNQKSHK